MRRHILLSDANLAEFLLSGSVNELRLVFTSMQDGAEMATACCTGLAQVIYRADADDSLPQYVGEVTISPVPKAFGTSETDRGTHFPPYSLEGEKGLYLLIIEGGVEAEIQCREVVWSRRQQ